MNKKHQKVPINRNDRFWMDAMDFLGAITKAGGYPDFLISWIKEVLNILREEKTNIFLVMPEDGCWGISIAGKDSYIFSYNDVDNIYISYRLYKYLKEKNTYNHLAGVLLHEIAEFIMRVRAEKKGHPVDINKNHGEAMRLEKALVGTSLMDLFTKLVSQELDRRKVSLDKQDVFVEGCAISGEEIVTEISSFRHPDESFILQLAPGQTKTLPYSGGYFTVRTEGLTDPFTLYPIDFKAYCNLMVIMDDLFIEESVINDESPFVELLAYIRGLDFTSEDDNFLLRILWLFTERSFNDKTPRVEFLYNIFLLVDEYITYFIMRDIVKEDYWKKGRFIKDNADEIADLVYKEKPYFVKREKRLIVDWLLSWFSEMSSVPGFSYPDTIRYIKEIPRSVYRRKIGPSAITDYEEDIYKELYLHAEILEILQRLRLLMNEPRDYRGFGRGDDPRVYELNMVRVHFWRNKNIFIRGEAVGIYSHDKGCALAEIIDVKDHSVVIFLKDSGIDIPDTGYIKKLEEEDLSIRVSIEAISGIKRGGWIDKFL